MNKTEKLAYDWLIANNYTGIIFRSIKTPDFLTEQGESFEVKKVRNGTIWFARGQFEGLLNTDNASVLVFSNRSEPEAVIPVEDLRLRPKVWKNIRVLVGKQGSAIVLRIPDNEFEAIKEAAKADYRSINNWCGRALLAATEVKRGVNLKQIGEEAIAHFRDEKGKFIKK